MGGVRRIKRLAGRVVARAGVVAADDEVGAPVVASDDRVEQDFTGAGHPHRERKKAEDDRAGLVVVIDQRAIATNAGVMVDVAGLCHSDDGMNQQTAADLFSRALGEFLVSPVERVAGLERDDLGPAEFGEVLAEFAGGLTQLDEVVVRRRADHFELAGGVVVGLAVEIGNGGMLRVGRAVGALRFDRLVERVDFLDVKEGEEVAVDVAKRDRLANLDTVSGLDRESDRKRPERAVGEPPFGDHAVIVGLAEEAGQR